jgi:hypothetical protein
VVAAEHLGPAVRAAQRGCPWRFGRVTAGAQHGAPAVGQPHSRHAVGQVLVPGHSHGARVDVGAEHVTKAPSQLV